MPSRRSFLLTTGATAAGTLLAPYVHGRGLEGMLSAAPLPPNAIRLSSNENPYGPGPRALQAITAALGVSNRYPGESYTSLSGAIAKNFGINSNNVVLGCGSTDILRASVYAFCDSSHGLVTCSPGFETPVDEAKKIGAPIRQVPVTGDLKLDLDAMASAARGAGLVYLCNPNNPTSTVHGKDAIAAFVNRMGKNSPSTTILIDEAYHEYVDDPSYATSVSIAMQNPRVFIARTFSKVFGMAGLRVGYALGDAQTMRKLGAHTLDMGVNQLGAFAATSSIIDRVRVSEQQRLNRAARAYSVKAFSDLGFKVADTQANFFMVNLRRNAQPFREACAKEKVLVGRPFPPLDTYVRISVGTMDEMQRAVDVFTNVLRVV